MHADEHVLQNAHLVEQALVLEGARDSQCGDRVRGASDQFGAAVIEGNAARGCAVQPADHVERGGLARAVRADQPGDLSVLDDQIQLLQRTQPAERHRQAADLEQRHPSPPRPGWTGRLLHHDRLDLLEAQSLDLVDEDHAAGHRPCRRRPCRRSASRASRFPSLWRIVGSGPILWRLLGAPSRISAYPSTAGPVLRAWQAKKTAADRLPLTCGHRNAITSAKVPCARPRDAARSCRSARSR